MKPSRRPGWLFCALAAAVVGGCSSIFAPGNLQVAVSAEDEVATPLEPAVLHVTAANTGGGPVAWGPGSSTCHTSSSE